MTCTGDVGRGVLVVGMHRSGTSAMARVLNLLGLPLCRRDDLLPHRNGNPTGHWESASLMACNERLLAALGARWNRLPHPHDPQVPWHALAAHAPSARAAFRAAHPTTTWAWKDPRLCLLVSHWRTVLACNPPIVLMIRHPHEVATSLYARDRLDRGTALRLWENSLHHALLGCAGAAVLVVRYPDLLADAVTTSHRVIEFLATEGVSVSAADAAVRDFIDPGLRHAREELQHLTSTDELTTTQTALLAVVSGLDAEYREFVPPALLGGACRDGGPMPAEWQEWLQEAVRRGCSHEEIVVAAVRGGLPLRHLAQALDRMRENAQARRVLTVVPATQV